MEAFALAIKVFEELMHYFLIYLYISFIGLCVFNLNFTHVCLSVIICIELFKDFEDIVLADVYFQMKWAWGRQ